MTRIVPYIMVMCLLLAGCPTYGPRGPYIKTDFVGPWVDVGERAEVCERQYHSKSEDYFVTYLRHRSIRRTIGVYDLCMEFGFEKTRFWRQWPASDNSIFDEGFFYDGYISNRIAPFKFYLVSISPTVIVGVSKEGDRFVEPERDRRRHPLHMNFLPLPYSGVWIMTQLSASPDARLVYFAPELSMELEVLNFGPGSTAISLPDGSQLTFSRERTTINIVRENKSPTK